MADTTWVLCDSGGEPVTEINNAIQKRFTTRRNVGASASLTLTHQDFEASGLLDNLAFGTPQLRYYRDGELRLSSQLTSIEEGVSDGEDTLTAVFKDAFGVLLGDGATSGRVLPLAITGGLVDEIIDFIIVQLNADAETGIRTVPRSADDGLVVVSTGWREGKNSGQAIVELTEFEGSFDVIFTPLDPTEEDGKLLELSYTFREGEDQGSSLQWGYGPGTLANVVSVHRFVSPPVNHVHIDVYDTDSIYTPVDVTDEESITTFGKQTLSVQAPQGLDDLDDLAIYARGFLQPSWQKITSFQPDPVSGPQPFDDFGLGDSGIFTASDGSFSENFTALINGFTITESPDEDEVYDLEIVDV